jgi:outer membrane protein
MRYAMAVLIPVLVVLVAPSIARAAGEAPAGSGGTPGGPITFGIVDVKRVIDECEYRKLYEGKLDELRQRKQLEAVDLKQEVDKQIGELQREQFLRAEEAREEIQKEIDAQEKRLRDFVIAARKAVEDESRKFSDELEGKVKAIVEEVAEERGVNVVLNSLAVLYKSGVVDLTELVLAKLNDQ